MLKLMIEKNYFLKMNNYNPKYKNYKINYKFFYLMNNKEIQILK